MNKLKELNFNAASVAKLLIAVAAIAHMIFNYIHTNALLLLVNEICGFIMFMFVLAGLVTLFEATQAKAESVLTKVITGCLCLCTTALGKLLLDIYQDAIKHQAGLTTAPVVKASNFTMIMMAAFTLAGVLMVIDAIITFRKNKNQSDEYV